jgi:hypothetical protein
VNHIGNNFAGADVQVAGDGGKVPRSSGSFPEAGAPKVLRGGYRNNDAERYNRRYTEYLGV